MKQVVKKINEVFALLPVRDGASGTLKIHEGAIATIAKRAVMEVEGVTRLSGSSFVDNIAELVGSKKIMDRSISIRISGSHVSIELAINVLYGVHLPDVASAVQQSVMEAVTNLTGLSVQKVNVNIREMEDLPVENEEGGEL